MDFRSRSEERSIHAFRAALKHRTLNIAPYSFGKGAPFCAPQQSGRFCRSSRRKPRRFSTSLSVVIPTEGRSLARRGTRFLRPGSASTHPHHHSAFGRHPEERSDEGSLPSLIHAAIPSAALALPKTHSALNASTGFTSATLLDGK